MTTEASGSSGHGSRALGEVHNLIRKDILEYDAKSLADTLSSTLVKWYVILNFGEQDQYPKFEFQLDEGMDLQIMSAAIANINRAGYEVDGQFIIDSGIPLVMEDGIVDGKPAKVPKFTPPSQNKPFGNEPTNLNQGVTQ